MKSKVFVSLLIASVMLVTLATPALAGRPAKGDLFEWDGGVVSGTETGSVSLQRTRDNYIKLSLVLKGATPGERYYIRFPNNAAYWPDTGESAIYANSRGVVRVRLTSTQTISAISMAIVVDEGANDQVWEFGTYALQVPSN
ncbi:hypothetical protein ACFLW7_03955 [Chloroflexota bacterium]